MTEIQLLFNRKDFEELYFSENRNKILFHPNVKADTLLLLLFGGVSLFLFLRYVYTDQISIIIILFVTFFIFQFFTWKAKITDIITWRKGVKAYLDRTEKYKSHKIIFTEHTFAVIQDEEATIENWENFKRVKIQENVVILYGNEEFILPKKSMKMEDFELLKREIKAKVR